MSELHPLADLNGRYEGERAVLGQSLHVRRVATTGVFAQTAQNTVWRQFCMVVDMHVAVQMTCLWFRQCKLQRQGSQCKLYRRPEIPWCSSGIVVDMPVGVSTTGYGSDCAKLWGNCGVLHVPQLCSSSTLDVPANMQRRRTRKGTHFASFLDFVW